MWLKITQLPGFRRHTLQSEHSVRIWLQCKSVFWEEIMVISEVWYFGLFDN